MKTKLGPFRRLVTTRQRHRQTDNS